MKKKDITGLKILGNSHDDKNVKVEIQFVGRQESFNNSVWLTPSDAIFFGESMIKLGSRMIKAAIADVEERKLKKKLEREERKEAS